MPGVPRCSRCRMWRCLCATIPTVPARTRIVIVRHVAEDAKASNTARLAILALPNSELHEHGRPGTGAMTDLGQGGWLLFPDGPVTGAARLATPPARLIVLDGTWPQARRMRQRIPGVRGLPVLCLPPPALPPRRLRVAPREDGMSTLEAIAAALALLEGDAVAAPLRQLHAAAVQASLLGHERAPAYH